MECHLPVWCVVDSGSLLTRRTGGEISDILVTLHKRQEEEDEDEEEAAS